MKIPISPAVVLASLLPALIVPSAFAEKKVKAAVKVASINPDLMKSRGMPDPGWTLRDNDGREIQAMLLSAHGDMVKIQRIDNEQEFDVPIAMFDSETKGRIRYWIKEDPEAVDYSLAISASRLLVNSTTTELSGRSFKKSEWGYQITIHNETRNELNGATVEYRIIYDDNVGFVRTQATPGKGENQRDGRTVSLPEMEFNDEIEFQTPTVEVETYEYVPNRGDREYLKDEIKGIWVRVVRHEEVIAEFRSNEAAMASMSWDDEEEVEITITNRFKESFGDNDG
ncbi:MAG: hypothetical protein P1U68_11430 [Verrucomicrobiales bacterium]|nr:hypothetical protein [Verrucomicrobiales bacterium]